MPQADRPFRTHLVGLALARVRAGGGDTQALLREFELPATVETEPEITLDLHRFHALGDALAAAARDQFLGLHLGAALEHGAQGLFEFSYLSAPTIGAGLERVVRYMRLLNELIEVSLTVRGSEALLEHKIPGEPLGAGRQSNEFFVACVLARARRLTATPFVPSRAWFAHPAPREPGELLAYLGTTQVEFGRESSGFAVPRTALDLPLATSDPALLRVLDEVAARALKERGGHTDFVGRVREQVRVQLANGAPSLAATARALKMSVRTLQRRLDGERTAFAELVERVRSDLAQLYLDDRARPLAEVAYLCGYSELSAFLRAFRRWTGKTPTEYRRHHGGDQWLKSR